MEKQEKRTECQAILELLENSHTTVRIKEDMKGNYYSYFTDTIYLNAERGEACGELVTLCHECVHSIQDRWIHILNMVASNLSLILAITTFTFWICGVKSYWLTYIAIGATLVAIGTRLILEIGAVLYSTVIASQYAKEHEKQGITLEEIKKAEKRMKKLTPIFLFRSVVIRIVITIILIIYIMT